VKKHIKKLVFSNPIVFAGYKKLRAAEIRIRKTLLAKKYELLEKKSGNPYTEAKAVRLARQRISARGIDTSAKADKPLRIFLFGANEAQDKTGFYQALQKISDLVVFKNTKGEYGPEHDEQPFKKIFVDRNDAAFLEQLEAANKEAPIDLLIGQM